MASKWLSDPNFLVGLDFLLGIGSFAFEVAFLSTYGVATNYDLVGTGIWAGIIFAATAVILKTMDGKLNQLILLIGPCLSFICGIVLFSLSVAALSDLDKLCPIESDTIFGKVKYHCSTEIGLDVMLMLCGLLAIPVNGLLFLMVSGIKK